MSNRHVAELLLVYEALAKDASCAFPTLTRDFERDLARLRRLSRTRGILLFMEDLPAIGKHLDRCVAEEQYSVSGLPGNGRASTRGLFPKYLGGLLKLLFDDDGHLRKEELDVEAYLFLRQFLYCAKKVELACPQAAVSQEIENFVQVDHSLPLPETVWDQTSPSCEEMRSTYGGFSCVDSGYLERMESVGIPKPTATLLAKNLDLVFGFLASSLGPFRPSDWRFKHGPGAIADGKGPVNKYHWVNWPHRLEERYPIADYGYHNYGSWAGSCGEDITSHEGVSKLAAVPKDLTKPRLIAVEPAANQWCQQNLMAYFYARTKDTWPGLFIRFDDRTLNQDLCRIGSRDGSLLTCDLKSASDRITCNVVGQAFRSNPELLCHLQAVRTRYLKDGLTSPNSPRVIELRKFSTMGSACTFPIQSLLFLGITLAVSFTNEAKRVRTQDLWTRFGKVAVFGDDIIAPNDDWELLQKALSALHFVVNKPKSFATGRFRESCGIDAFRGVDVTPVYWKGICSSSPESIDSSLAVSNNFQKRFFIYAAERVRSTIPVYFAPVAMDSGVAGKKFFVRPTTRELRLRWNCLLQRLEACTSVLSTRSGKLTSCDDSGIFQYFTERPDPLVEWQSGVAEKPRQKIRRGWVTLESIGLQTDKMDLTYGIG